ncbi:thiocyanate hydrolase subunit gamma [Rhodococcus subtropicus]|uniref:thiocyanate hydrolase subunit gamma n=1 Tax=Prescottella subtropica TaxID=2545757 RepID=UPI0010F47DA8
MSTPSDEPDRTAPDDDSPPRHGAPMVEEVTDFEVLEIAIRELAIEKGLFTAEDHRRYTEYFEQLGPTPGSRLVAKAWSDPDYRQLVFEDPIAACTEIGVDWLQPTGFGTPSDFTALHILEDTPTLHHVIVCTLCSCYPRPLLGNSPEWYRTPNYRRRIVRWPRQVLGEFGLFLPEEVAIRVEDSNSKHRFAVLPVRPAGTDGWSEDRLAEIVTRDCLIGVALPTPGVTSNAARPVHPAVHPIGDQ